MYNDLKKQYNENYNWILEIESRKFSKSGDIETWEQLQDSNEWILEQIKNEDVS